MKKFIAIAILALFTSACAPTHHDGMMQNNRMQSGMMDENYPCCQSMDGMMMKNGEQCSMMMKGHENSGMQCDCCGNMMKNNMTQNKVKARKPAAKINDSHTQHH